MWKFLLLLCSAAFAIGRASENRIWQTLDGKPPLVIARGGFSGLFPDSSEIAYDLALRFSLPNVILWCDVQLTKEGAGVCLPDLKLQNSTNVDRVFQNNNTTYPVNEVSTTGWFPSDFYLKDLSNLSLTQGVYSRPPDFDNEFRILTVEEVGKLPISPKSSEPPGLWLSIQNDAFYRQQSLSMGGFAMSISKRAVVKYISSPEVVFLKSIQESFKQSTTKLVFQFLGESEIDPSTKLTYGDILKNLRAVKEFADGILVPKSYIWPVDRDSYLLPHTSLVLDAHKAGLQVFASGFANDIPYAHDFNNDPVAENLAFIDKADFSVDGVLSDFPITPSAAIDCFSYMGKDGSAEKNALVISHEGASGVYPGCTDLAYRTAFSDGVDIIDCPVQMTKDGVPICLGSINLMKRTTVAQSPFSNLARTIPELGGTGIFTFDLTWDQIQSLKPEIFNPEPEYHLYPNPRFRNAGNFTSLWFLMQSILSSRKSTTSHVSGLLINIENAAYLEKQGLDIKGAVLDALNASGYNNQADIKVMIQSSDSSVLIKFKEKSKHELVYEIKEDIQDINDSTILDIQKFANSVVISKASVYPDNRLFLTAWDFFSDAYVEIDTYVKGAGADGVITDFPRTANNYRRNRCLGMREKPSYMSPIKPAELLKYVRSASPAPPPGPVQPPLPPLKADNYKSGNRRLGKALPPSPVLSDSDVIIEPPLHPVMV